MNPADLRKHLAEYADGELPETLRGSIEARLAADRDARDEVERWQALRRCAGRALDSEPVPPGLEARIRATLRVHSSPGRRRVLHLGTSGLAVAAALLLTVFVWPQGAEATSIGAAYLADQHRASALTRRADLFGVRRGMSWKKFDRLRKEGDFGQIAAHASFRCRVPSMLAQGYRLQGACEYVRGDRTRVVHAYFRCLEAGGNTMSLFVMDRCVRLCSEGGKPGHCCHGDRREYHVARHGKYTLIAWVQDGRTYVLCCGIAEPEDLVRMADVSASR